jgi:hypothetical protein
MTDKDKLIAALILAEKIQIIPIGFNGEEGERKRGREEERERGREGESVSDKLEHYKYMLKELNLSERHIWWIEAQIREIENARNAK